MFQLLPDVKKSWSWSTNAVGKSDLVKIQKTSCHLGQLQHFSRATDLGASLCYRGGKRIASIREKIQEACDRIGRSHGIPMTLKQQWRVVQTSASAKALHALEITPLGFSHFAKLRKKIANLITLSQNRNEFLTTSLTHYPVVDPEITTMKNSIRLARRFLLQHPEDQQTFFDALYQLPSDTCKIKGPIGCLKRWINRIGWSVTPDGNVVTQDNLVISLISTCIKQWFVLIDEAWFSQVVTGEVAHRQGCENLPCADLATTAKSLQQLDDKEQKIMAKSCSAAWTHGNQAAHWRTDQSDRCDFCGEPDSAEHRLLRCSYFQTVRDDFHDLLEWVETHAAFWLYCPYIPLHPDVARWRLQCAIPITMYRGPFLWDDQCGLQRFFTDGSSYGSNTTNACQSYWAVVWDASENEEQRKLQAERYKATGFKPDSLKTLHKGPVQGAQSIGRAELTAIISCLYLAEKLEVCGDSSYALDILDEILEGTSLEHFHKRVNFDLIIQLFQAVGSRTRDEIRWKKIKSHQSLEEVQDLLQLYDALGNDAADLSAKSCHECVREDVQTMVDEISNHEKEWSKQLLSFAKFSCILTYEASKFFRKDGESQMENNTSDRSESLIAWQFEAPKVCYAIPEIPQWESKFVYGEHFMLALKFWLQSISWPAHAVEGSPGITWLELYVDFVIAKIGRAHV